MNELTKTLIALSGDQNVVVVRKALVNFTGTLEAGIMLGQLLYWSGKTKTGWIAKSDAEFMDELCLSRYAVRRATRILHDMGIIQVVVKKFNGAPTNHYHLDIDNLTEQWIVWIQTMESTISDNPLSENGQSLTETTTETTTEILPAGDIFFVPEKVEPETPNPETVDPFLESENWIEGMPPEEWFIKKSAEQGRGGAQKPERLNIEEYKQRVRQSVAEAKPRWDGAPDLSKWPEDVREMLYGICYFWRINPPNTLAGRSVPVDAYWLKGARELLDACGEYGYEKIIKLIKDDYEVERVNNRTALSIASPKSLVNLARAKAGQLRVEDANRQKRFF